jgi:hypothetical protein
MYDKILKDPSFFDWLYKIDKDIAEKFRLTACSFCGDKLHIGNYVRKPRGSPSKNEDFNLCFSFCCRREGCRKRKRPASVRFLGRFVYISFIVVVLSGSSKKLGRLRKIFNLPVDRKTLKRWRNWWDQRFARSAFWREQRGRLNGSIGSPYPQDILEYFRQIHQDNRKVCEEVLIFFSPLCGQVL